MPRGVLSADQHQNLILRKYDNAARFRLTGYWDLWDVMPLFNVPACVLFAKRDTLIGSSKDKLAVEEWSGNLPERDVAWDTAKNLLTSEVKEGHVIYLGSRAALSTAPGATSPTKPSKYLDVFKQGATIVPRSFYFVHIDDLNIADRDRVYWAETDPEQAALAKKPYDQVTLNGQVEGRFVYCTVLGRHILPFASASPATVVLPVKEKDGNLSVIRADKLKADGYREFAKWMLTAEEIWNDKRKEKADKQSLYERLEYQGGLSAQHFSHRYLVLYNAEGTNVAATFFDRHSYALPLVVEHTVYWAALANRNEADYLCAVLNSQTVNLAIKPFQATGLLGERHIQKKLLELPIPTFDHENKAHTDIAKLGVQAREEAAKVIGSAEYPADTSIARQRGFVRLNLKDTMKGIDKLVAVLLKG